MKKIICLMVFAAATLTTSCAGYSHSRVRVVEYETHDHHMEVVGEYRVYSHHHRHRHPRIRHHPRHRHPRNAVVLPNTTRIKKYNKRHKKRRINRPRRFRRRR